MVNAFLIIIAHVLLDGLNLHISFYHVLELILVTTLTNFIAYYHKKTKKIEKKNLLDIGKYKTSLNRFQYHIQEIITINFTTHTPIFSEI